MALGARTISRIGRFRIPVDSWKPDRMFIVSLDYESCVPTVDELVMLRSYQVYAVVSLYNETYAQRILAKQFPAMGGHNTVTFKKKGPGKWLFRRWTWEMGPTYVPVDNEYRQTGLPLTDILDRVNRCGPEDQPPNGRWLKWKTEHPGIFRPN